MVQEEPTPLCSLKFGFFHLCFQALVLDAKEGPIRYSHYGVGNAASSGQVAVSTKEPYKYRRNMVLEKNKEFFMSQQDM
jgi:hypothetical protein